jgi:hypothetical protein
MKEETNKELDLLLRRLSRRQDGAVGSSITGEHLDADELSSYAENVLPAAARMRYTEHLAECTRCRELVVQLSSAAGVIATDQTAKAPAPSGLRNFLASLFSPMVLRYAVPAVGLIVVAAIAFFVMDDRRGASEVATSAPPQPVAAGSPTFSLEDSDKQGRLQSNTNTPEASASAKKSEDKERAIHSVTNAPPVVGITAEVKKDVPAKEGEQTAANAPPAAKREPEPQPTVNDFRVDIQTQEARIEQKTSDVAKLQREKPADQPKAADRTENKATDSIAAAAPATGGGISSSRRAARPGVVQSQRDGVDADDDAVIRVVAGRRFRREADIWIDTAYSGAATTNLARGSEQYRALIADEPSIKSIADQLGGEIIVVWKGRAYRIR